MQHPPLTEVLLRGCVPVCVVVAFYSLSSGSVKD